jgi:hypothetical protein
MRSSAEDKVAATGPLLEPQMSKETSKIVEVNVGVRCTAEDAVGKVLIPAHGGDCSLGEGEGSVAEGKVVLGGRSWVHGLLLGLEFVEEVLGARRGNGEIPGGARHGVSVYVAQ